MAYFEQDDISKKDDFTCVMLAIFLGRFGAHRFYVGKIGTGILYLLTCNLELWFFIFSRLFDLSFLQSFVAILIANMYMGVACLYDVYALYSESFTDADGKIIVSRATKEECGMRVKKKSDRLVNAGIIICAAILFYAFRYAVL